MIPKSFIDELLTRLDIIDVVEEFVPLKKVGRNFVARCPFHSEKTPSFSVSRDKQMFHCFGCGASGSAIKFVMDYSRLGFVDAVEQLAGKIGLELPEQHGSIGEKTSRRNDVLDVLEAASKFYEKQLRQHPDRERVVAYLKGRGLHGATAKAFSFGYAPSGWNTLLRALGTSPSRIRLLEQAGLIVAKEGGSHYDRFRDRIMFPIRDTRGRVIAFGGRVLGDGEPKYLNSPETALFRKGEELYGLFQARQAHRDLARILVVEGYMDVVMLSQFGVTTAVATLGTATTGEHIRKLFRYTSEIVFCFDGDAAGRRAAWRALESSLPYLADGRSVGYLFLPNGEDPDTVVQAQGMQFFQNAENVVPLTDFLIERLRAGGNVRSFEAKARLAAKAAPLLDKLPEGALKQLVQQRLEMEIGVTNVTQHRETDRRSAKSPGRQQPLHVSGRVKRAARALVHYPRLALAVQNADALLALQLDGISTLVELINVVQSHPDVTNPAQIAEYFRDTPLGQEVSNLAGAPLELATDAQNDELEQAAATEFDWAIRYFFARLEQDKFSRKQILETKRRLSDTV